MRTWLSIKTMSPSELRQFFKEYCARWGFTMKEAREYRIWWAMFYTWKDGGWWTEDENKRNTHVLGKMGL